MLLDNIQFNCTQLSNGLKALSLEHAALTAQALTVSDITLDSRNVTIEHAFIAMRGALADGHAYIDDAISRGCKLVLCESIPSENTLEHAKAQDCSILSVTQLKQRLPTLLSQLFTSQHKTNITAVTGTNGKTSVASLYAQLALSSQEQSACLGTLGLNVYTLENHQVTMHNMPVGVNTTPDIVSHYKVLALLQAKGINNYCLEASSHGIEQQRLAGLPISTAIFTNLTQDHLDYHGTLAAYASAKRGLLKVSSLKQVVLNADDPESQQWRDDCAANVSIAWYGKRSENIPANAEHFCLASNLRYTHEGISFLLTSSWGNADLHSPLFGDFNVSNLLAALSARLLQGESFKALTEQIKCVKGVLGRMELFVNDSPHANMIVDYAHTPDALQQALVAARRHTSGKLYCVFGCGGDRDKTKRPLMGKAASDCSDVVVLTQDNTRNESALEIVNDIKAGIHGTGDVHVELDRKSAVRWAWKNSHKGDLILVAGKGHEDYLEINNQRIPYNERAFVQQLSTEAVA
ncbi:UDP-N-acetylmuramoyl-L-alanyl-D-glutamate--2,6-diaminopimelate ligase [Glaciecola sp. SC05]|uniref:UDP-N-acetylmuramoyl-L-alanyl-D-glutamate--2, 6-diaminopimelate ligase n=1 Tax=Glaciecola sp. SC05 TaxID=1987355 RepID=UPI003527F99B